MDEFWKTTALADMSESQWESLCDGCGRCCLLKLEDEESGEIFSSDVHCRLFNPKTCRCNNYEQRQSLVPDCIKLDVENVTKLGWVPKTCAYRRLAEGRGLAWWHPLVSGDPQTVIEAGISVKGRTISEDAVKPGEWEDHIAEWADTDPDADDESAK